MRLAVLSDVHGLCLALEAVWEDIQQAGFDLLVCNGDMVQGGPQPRETVQLLREMAPAGIVMGNSDAWLLTGVETGAEQITEERRAQLDLVREWSLAHLADEDRAFIRSFQPSVRLHLGLGRSLLAFHGSPTDFDRILLPSTPEEEFESVLEPYAGSILTGGHTHLPFARRLRDSANFFFNPGSVGVAYNHEQSDERGRLDPWAEYAILTAGSGPRVSLEFRRVPLDLRALAEIYRRSGRPFAESAMGNYLHYDHPDEEAR